MAYQVSELHLFTSDTAKSAWFDLILRRHQNKITIHKPVGTSFLRANGLKEDVLDKFFDILQAEYDKHNFPPDRVYNVD